MPLYDYACTGCGAKDTLLAALDDHTALCTACGGVMLRLDQDLFEGYFHQTAGGNHGAAETPTAPPQPPGFLYQQGLVSTNAEKKPDCPWCVGLHEGTSKICPRHAAELREEIAAL